MLAKCKHTDCAGEIEVPDVRKATAIPKAPHHLALVAECATCLRLGQYVIERAVWDSERAAHDERVKEPVSVYDRATRAAEIEVNAIDTADELISYWSSLRMPPIIEGLVGACKCDDCNRKFYI